MLKTTGRLFASLAFLLLVFAAKAQNQKGYITFVDGGDDFVALRIDILQKDSLAKTVVLYKDSVDITDTLPVGEYDIRVYGPYNDNKLALTIHNIKIREGEAFFQIITFPHSYYESNNKSSGVSPYEGNIYVGYGTKTLETDPKYPVTGSYMVGMSGIIFPAAAKHHALGLLYGSMMSLSTFDKSKPLKPYIPYTSERYFYWNFNAGVITRICAFNLQSKEGRGFFVDAFATYNLPIMFRHTMVNGDHKIVDHRIHQFTDLSAGVRIGYYPVALQVEYRITDYLIAGYPEMPLLRFGISIMIPGYN